MPNFSLKIYSRLLVFPGTSWNGTKCAPITYTLTINKAGTGSGTVTGAGIYNYNTPVTVSASASVGSTFGGWSGDCSGTSSSTSVTMTSNKTCTATFNLNSYTVTPSATNCSISPSTPQTVSYGSTASFTVTPNAGYTASVTGCGGSLSGTTYTTTTISSNCSVTATCNQMYGTLTPSNQTCYVPLNGSSCTNVPLSWTTTNPVGTSAVTNNGGATPASPTGNNSSASFTVPYKASGVSFYLYNNAIQLATAVVNTVCSSGAWNSSVGACKQYTQYTLTYTAGTGGTISGTTPQTVDYGANGTAVTAVPNSGYSFTSWSDGTSTATRTDTNITANKSVTSTFTLSSCSNAQTIHQLVLQ